MWNRMKKRIKRKIEKKLALLDFSEMTKYCNECNSKMVIKNSKMIVKEPFLGEITLTGCHPVCPNGCEEFYTSKMLMNEKRLIKMKMQDLLLKYYPQEKFEYISIDEMSKLENLTINELIKQDEEFLPIFYIVKNKKRFYLKKSYDLFKKSCLKYHAGWFDISN